MNNEVIEQQNFCDWVDMEQLMDYSDIVDKNRPIMKQIYIPDKNLSMDNISLAWP